MEVTASLLLFFSVMKGISKREDFRSQMTGIRFVLCQRIDTAYNYQLNCLLREEELKTISERCKVIVSVWGDPRMNDGEYTLEEYLELRDQP